MSVALQASFSPNQNSWLCCQIGAREHYAVPRALQQQNALKRLFTDAWVRPRRWSRFGKDGFSTRFHIGLADADVVAPNLRVVGFEMKARIRSRSGWQMMLDRNEWFQRFVISQLDADGLTRSSQPLTVFAYSYAAAQVFKFAKEVGWKTVLGQIDPGPAEERLMKQLDSGAQSNVTDWEPAPSEYWEKWHSECELADHIVVNSKWSRDALVSEGVDPQKMKVIPLGYEESAQARIFEREYPERFTPSRPMRVLFLGQIGLRKGAARLFDAVARLSEHPIEFWFVGPIQVAVPDGLRANPRVKWFDVVPRDAVAEYYRSADVFIFPTLSDGFGLTQLEAQSWKLPIIASLYCGSVVHHEVNGLILPEVSAEAIADALLSLLRSPEKLRLMSSRSELRDEFSLRSLASSLLTLQKCPR